MASSLARRIARLPFLLAFSIVPLGSFALPSCSVSPGVCGDARVDRFTADQKASDTTLVDEECDDGNTIDTDACTQLCKLAACGDGFIQTENNEQSDDKDYGTRDVCSRDCVEAERFST